MEKVIPWEKLVDKIDRHHATTATGRPRTDTLLMLKIYFLQQWYNLSDPGMEDAIFDRVSFQKFLDLDVLAQAVPDESTICRFRHFLEGNKLQRKMFKILNAVLENEGLLVKE
jgi:IS5 family transposase